ncbi:hypothetical protein GOV05_02675 [Candidatus Woesearchaeota archaeon]|nr:hypothetical protein [Candidatus Woesearchaeota archaeon]
MTDLVVCLTEKKGYRHVKRLINETDWSRIFVVTRHEVKSEFKFDKSVIYIEIDPGKPIQEVINDIKSKLSFMFGEVGLNLVSGTGKEHMAIIAALIRSGAGFRLVAMTKEGLVQL